MNVTTLILMGQERHGTENWIGPFAEELGYSFSGLWRIINQEVPITRRLDKAIDRLPERKAKKHEKAD